MLFEAFRSGKTIDKLFVLDGCQDGPVHDRKRSKKHDTIIHFVEKERLDQLSETKKHQGRDRGGGSVRICGSGRHSEIAREKGEPPFLFLLDNIEDPQQSRGDHPYREPLRSTRGHYSKAQGGGTDRDCGKDVCRRAELYAGSKGDESDGDDQGVKGAGHMVCLRGYGRHADV